jgi:hypothetical protein
MSYVIRLLQTRHGEPTEFDGQFVSEYDPAYVHPEGYDGGILHTTPDLARAKRFDTMLEAIAYYRQKYGMRENGEPNRPLTAWNVEIFSEPRAADLARRRA